MLVRLPIFASLATLAVADFKIYWEARSDSTKNLGAAIEGGVKLFANTPDCKNFRTGGKELAINLGRDVSDSQGGGYVCDGCNPTQDWKDWVPSRIEMNDKNKKVFPAEPFHITLSKNQDGNYTVKDTKNVVYGNCMLVSKPVKEREIVPCDGKDNKNGNKALEAFDCKTEKITI